MELKISDAIAPLVSLVLADLRAYLSDHGIRVDCIHVGGTAVPGVLTKGDVDVVFRVEARDFLKLRTDLSSCFEVRQFDNWTVDFASFGSDTRFTLPVGVQLVVIGSENDVFLYLLNRLLDSELLRKEYSGLKVRYRLNATEYSLAKHKCFMGILADRA